MAVGVGVTSFLVKAKSNSNPNNGGVASVIEHACVFFNKGLPSSTTSN